MTLGCLPIPVRQDQSRIGRPHNADSDSTPTQPWKPERGPTGAFLVRAAPLYDSTRRGNLRSSVFLTSIQEVEAVRRFVVGLAVTAAVAVIVPVVAFAEGSDPNGKAAFVGMIRSSGKTATLKVSYRCASGEALWVSAKQTASGLSATRLMKEGSSKGSAGWLESHRNKFVCNGKMHTGTFAIDTVEKGSKGTLKSGTAWVQFCVTKGQGT